MSLPPLLVVTSYPPYLIGMLVGFVVGVVGHLTRSTVLIALGILAIGGTSIALLTAVSAS